jgi:hypothetical protein
MRKSVLFSFLKRTLALRQGIPSLSNSRTYEGRFGGAKICGKIRQNELGSHYGFASNVRNFNKYSRVSLQNSAGKTDARKSR